MELGITSSVCQVTAGGTVKDAPVVNGYIFAADATKAVDVSDYAVV